MEQNFKELLETIVLIIAVTTPISAAVLGFIRKKLSCIEKIKDEVESLQQRGLRQSKGLIILSHRLDTINDYQHPNNSKLNLGREMETILKDEEGNL